MDPRRSGTLQSVQLDVSGMTCASCAARIEKKLNRLEGVNATVNYATEKATVQFGGATTPQTLIETIERTGYGASLPSDGEHDPDHDVRVAGSADPRGRRAQPAGDRARHGARVAVRRVAVALPAAQPARGRLGRLALPRHRGAQPGPGQRQHGHPDLARLPGGARLVGLRAAVRGGRADRLHPPLRAAAGAARRDGQPVPGGGGGHHHVPPGRAVPGGAGQAPVAGPRCAGWSASSRRRSRCGGTARSR